MIKLTASTFLPRNAFYKKIYFRLNDTTTKKPVIKEGIQARVDMCQDATWETVDKDCPRVILVPLYLPVEDSFTTTNKGTRYTQVEVVGFVHVFIEGIDNNGNIKATTLGKLIMDGSLGGDRSLNGNCYLFDSDYDDDDDDDDSITDFCSYYGESKSVLID